MNKAIVIGIILIFLIFGILITLVFLDKKIVSESLTINEMQNNSVSQEDNSDSISIESEKNSSNFKNNDSNEKIDSTENILKEDACDINNSEDNSIECFVKEENLNESNDESDKENESIENSEVKVIKNLAYDFLLINLAGEKVRLSDYRGQKPVIVEFWNSWCHNCQREMPKLQKIYGEYDGKFEIIGVNLLKNKDDKDKVKAFIKKYGITFPIVLDETLFVASKYKVKATNHHFLINMDGTIYDSFFIDLEKKKLDEFLKFNGME
ncbi:MAG: redoxin domain-containing protein [Candidatus Moranbacteria bacterium]|nr:redoxin domain-containing protein [Candidatus Moranbacteria bacterium]